MALLLAGLAVIYLWSHAVFGSAPRAVPHTGNPGTGTIDSVQCSDSEQLAYHIHVHLALYDGGKSVRLPSGIGMPGGEDNALCYYWVHVHAFTPGIIHVESPVKKIFPLGTFFDIWKDTAATANPPDDTFVRKLEAAARTGQVTTFVDGKKWHGSYRRVPLSAHAVVTLEIGKPIVPPKPFSAWNGL